MASPIKGTIRRSNDPQEDSHLQEELLACTKNQAENVMIVDLLRNDLGKIALPGSVKVSKLLSLQSFKSVHHLVSDIQAKPLPDLHPLEFISFLLSWGFNYWCAKIRGNACYCGT